MGVRVLRQTRPAQAGIALLLWDSRPPVGEEERAEEAWRPDRGHPAEGVMANRPPVVRAAPREIVEATAGVELGMAAEAVVAEPAGLEATPGISPVETVAPGWRIPSLGRAFFTVVAAGVDRITTKIPLPPEDRGWEGTVRWEPVETG